MVVEPGHARFIILDPSEDPASLRAKLEDALPGYLVVVAPKDVAGLQNPLMLRVMERFLSTFRGTARFVVQDADVAGAARGMGIRTQTSLRGTELTQDEVAEVRRRLKESGRPSGWVWSNPLLGSAAAAIVALVVFGAVLLPFLALFPSATVVLPLETRPIVVERDLRLVQTTTQPNLEQNTIPGQRLQANFRVTVETRADAAQIQPGAASGTVTITNRVNEAQRLPAQTELLSITGRRFQTLDAVTVPAGGSVNARIRAAEPGVAGNVVAGSVSRFSDAALGQRLTVRNAEATTGGRAPERASVTTEDYNRLREQAIAGVAQAAGGELQQLLRDGQVLVSETVATGVASERFSHPIGDPVPEVLRLEVEGIAVGWVYQPAAIDRFASALFEREGVAARLAPGSQGVNRIGIVTSVGGEETTIRVRFTGGVLPEVNAEQLRKDLAGISVDEARALVSRRVPLREPPTITVVPNVFGLMPRADWRISLEFPTR